VTHRLYYTDSYRSSFDALVSDLADEGKRVYLDQTAFYPTSGGQPFDTGELDGVRVLDVVDEGERIAHLLAEPLRQSRVIGRIDWPRRFDHMQQHTGQHLLSAVIEEMLGRQTLSVHFGAEAATVDLDGGLLSTEDITRVELRANEVVTENRPVEIRFEHAASAGGLRKASAREGTLRIVAIRDLDRSACGGTHVRATGEIGPVLIRKVERLRSGVRLEFVCGGRAIRHARADYNLLTRMAAELTASAADLPQIILGIRAELKHLRTEVQDSQSELNRLKAGELYFATDPGADGIRRVLCREETGPLERLKGLGQAVAAMPMAIFIGATRQPPAVLVTASKDSGVDAGKLVKAALAETGGRGGGSAGLAQGVLPEAAQLNRAVQKILQF